MKIGKTPEFTTTDLEGGRVGAIGRETEAVTSPEACLRYVREVGICTWRDQVRLGGFPSTWARMAQTDRVETAVLSKQSEPHPPPK